jgi:hypothetical protein
MSFGSVASTPFLMMLRIASLTWTAAAYPARVSNLVPLNAARVDAINSGGGLVRAVAAAAAGYSPNQFDKILEEVAAGHSRAPRRLVPIRWRRRCNGVRFGAVPRFERPPRRTGGLRLRRATRTVAQWRTPRNGWREDGTKESVLVAIGAAQRFLSRAFFRRRHRRRRWDRTVERAISNAATAIRHSRCRTLRAHAL